jgi:hypothetical protein
VTKDPCRERELIGLYEKIFEKKFETTIEKVLGERRGNHGDRAPLFR